MFRVSSTSLLTVGVPAAVFFVLTANPARLYAEAGLPPAVCSAEVITTCANADAGATCSYDGGSGKCQADLCMSVDAGGTISTLRCRPEEPPFCAAQNQIDDCVGKTVGQSCGSTGGSGNCGTLQCPTIDGGTQPTLVCLYTGAEIDTEAGPPKEAGPGNDASPGSDAGTGSDASPNTSPEDDNGVADDGCSCGVVGQSASSIAMFPALGLALAALARRRARRR